MTSPFIASHTFKKFFPTCFKSTCNRENLRMLLRHVVVICALFKDIRKHFFFRNKYKYIKGVKMSVLQQRKNIPKVESEPAPEQILNDEQKPSRSS